MTAGKNQATPESELLSRLRGAARTIKELERRLAAAESAVPEPIAVLGVGCRFPGGATDPDRYWELLREGRDAISEIPADRWDDSALFDPDPDAPGKSYSRWMGALDDVARFDAALFGISPREARCIDPQQRQLLEVAWHALEHAGWSPLGLEGENVGVFVGIGSSGYTERHIGLHGRAAAQHEPARGRGRGEELSDQRVDRSIDQRVDRSVDQRVDQRRGVVRGVGGRRRVGRGVRGVGRGVRGRRRCAR